LILYDNRSNKNQAIRKKNIQPKVNNHSLADQIITYAIMIAVFVILTGIAFGLKRKRYNRDKIVGSYQDR
jgi:hypothetical protein